MAKKKKNKDRVDDEGNDGTVTRIPLKQLRNKGMRKRDAQRTLHKAKVMHENHQRRLANKGCLQIDIKDIRYADNYVDADRLAGNILRWLQRMRENDVIVGFDTEGFITVLHLFFQINAQVYQLNKILNLESHQPSHG